MVKQSRLKEFLTTIGIFVPPKAIHYSNAVLNYLHIGWWMKQRGFYVPRRWARREDLYAHLAKPLTHVPVSYLEFGVYKGESLRQWTGLLRDRQTRFFGFDSFEGLPENWVLSCGKGAFDVHGSLPTINDPRVTLHKGWFSDTLPGFIQEFTPEEQLILHLAGKGGPGGI